MPIIKPNSRVVERRVIRTPDGQKHAQLDRRSMPEKSVEGKLQEAKRLSNLKNKLLREKLIKIVSDYRKMGRELNEHELNGITEYLEKVLDRRIESRLVEARDFAERDLVTGLLREEKFKNLVEMYLLDHNKGTFLFIDVNFLKKVNDKYGHEAGNLLLKSMSKALEKIAKEYNLTTSRLGGDEFGAFSSEELSEEKLNEIIEKTRRAYKDIWKIDGKLTDIDASFAIGTAKRSEFSHQSNVTELYEALRKVADGRMYTNKKEMKAQRE